MTRQLSLTEATPIDVVIAAFPVLHDILLSDATPSCHWFDSWSQQDVPNQ